MSFQIFTTLVDVEAPHQEELVREQIRELYSNVTLTTVLSSCGASVMAFLAWSIVTPGQQSKILMWLAMFALLAVARVMNYMLYLRHEVLLDRNDELFIPKRWARRELIFALIYGSLFGGFFMLFYDTNQDLFYQMQIATFIFCMTVATANFLACYVPSFVAMAVSCGVLLVLRLLAEGDWVHLVAIPCVILFNVAVYNFVARLGNTFIESVQARLQNLDLIEALIEKKQLAEYANREKTKFIVSTGTELLQPLQAISEASVKMVKHVEAEEAKRLLKDIDRSVAALASLIGTLPYELAAKSLSSSESKEPSDLTELSII